MNVAVIGYGSRGEIYANGFFGQANIVAVCDPRKERLEYAQKNYGVHKEGLIPAKTLFLRQENSPIFVSFQQRINCITAMRSPRLTPGMIFCWKSRSLVRWQSAKRSAPLRKG